MFFVLSKILNFLLHPLLWVFILMLLALFIRRKKLRRLFLILAPVVLFVFGNGFLVDRFMGQWEHDPVPLDAVSHHDYGIVLGGMGSYNENSRRLHFYDGGDRLIQALTLYHQGLIDTLILSGGTGRLIGKGYRESKYLKDYLLMFGISESDVLIEAESRNTYENARHTVENFYDPQFSYLLTTSGFHMRRALGCFRQQGMNPDVFPTGPLTNELAKGPAYYVLPTTESFQKWNLLLKEWVGYVVYDVMGYI